MDNWKTLILIRKSLQNNKIFFETIAALLLGIMAIILSFAQIRISGDQTELIEKEKEIAKLSLHKEIFQDYIDNAIHWNELKRVLRKASIQLPAVLGSADFYMKMTYREQLNWLLKFEEIITPIGSNPLIIKNKLFYRHYLAMVSTLTMKIAFLRQNIGAPALLYDSLSIIDLQGQINDLWIILNYSGAVHQIPTTNDLDSFLGYFSKGLPWIKKMDKFENKNDSIYLDY